jgi:16S rRNA processing protein RimM
MSKKILIAKLLRAHGVRGEAKLIVFSDDISNLENYPLTNRDGISFKVKISRQKNQGADKTKTDPIIASITAAKDKIVIVRIEGIETREDIEKLVGTEFFTERKNFPTLEKNEFYISDLIGLRVFDIEQRELGKVKNANNFGSGASLEISFSKQALPLLPIGYSEEESFLFKDEIFPEINLNEGKIIFAPVEFEILE